MNWTVLKSKARNWVPLTIAVVLLVAASGKILSSDLSIFMSCVVVLEILFAWGILGNCIPSAFSQLLAVLVFSIFGTMSLLHSINGTPCGCFGSIAVSSWLVSVIDLILVIASILWWPLPNFRLWNNRLARFGSATISPLFFLVVGIVYYHDHERRIDDVGTLVKNSLDERGDNDESVPSVVMLVRTGCPDCLQQIANSRRLEGVFGFELVLAVVDDAPFTDPNFVRVKHAEFAKTPSWYIFREGEIQVWSEQLF